MPKRFDTYRFKDGITQLSADTFNPIFLDVDNRIAAIELLKISWLDAVALVTAQGLKRIDAVLQPSLDAINASSAQALQTVLDAQAALNALPSVAMQADLTTAVANMNAAIAAIPVPDTSVLENNIALNAFRIAINGALSLQKMVDGFVDEYADETGIDAVNSVNTVYDAVTDSYSKAVGVTANAVTPMTSNAGPNGTVSSGSVLNNDQATYGPWNAFNGANTGQWTFLAASNVYITYTFPASEIIHDLAFANFGALRYQYTTVTFEGINAGQANVMLSSMTAVDFDALPLDNGFRVIHTTNTALFTSYQIRFLGAGTGNVFSIPEIELRTAAPILNSLTLQSTTQSALTQPTTGNVILLEEDVDAVTLNTDLMAAVSRDGGTTWSNAPLVNKGLYQAGRNILTASADLSTQPAGQSMAYKITTANGKNLKLHGTSLGWK